MTTTQGPGFSDRLCPKCGTWSVHRIIEPRKAWECLTCGHITTKGA